MNLGETIKTLREEIDLTPSELAAKCKVSSTHIADIERGKRNPSENLLQRIALHLNTDVEPLLDSMRRRKEIIRKVRDNPEQFVNVLESEKV